MSTLTQHAIYIKMSEPVLIKVVCVSHINFEQAPGINGKQIPWRRPSSICAAEMAGVLAHSNSKLQIRVGQISKQRYSIHEAAANDLH